MNIPNSDWDPSEPATATLTVSIEAHDATVVHERLNRMVDELRAEYGDNVGTMTVLVERN